MTATTLFVTLCWTQGLYYLLTGLWPLVSIRSFQAVSGKKTDNWTGNEADHWLVNTVAVLIIAIGLALVIAGQRGQPTPEIVALAMAGNVGLAAIDVIYVARRVILPIYLLDAVIEVILLAAWIAFVMMGRFN